MLVQKLRLYAMIMRLRELEQERIERRLRQFERPPLIITRIPEFEPKVNPMNFDYPKSKYIDKPLRNYKR